MHNVNLYVSKYDTNKHHHNNKCENHIPVIFAFIILSTVVFVTRQYVN